MSLYSYISMCILLVYFVIEKSAVLFQSKVIFTGSFINF
jgi:hypothetical protein